MNSQEIEILKTIDIAKLTEANLELQRGLREFRISLQAIDNDCVRRLIESPEWIALLRQRLSVSRDSQ